MPRVSVIVARQKEEKVEGGFEGGCDRFGEVSGPRIRQMVLIKQVEVPLFCHASLF